MIRNWHVHTPNGDREVERPAPSRDDDHAPDHSARLERYLIGLLVVLMVIFSAIPIVIDLRGLPNKDYSLWYQVGGRCGKGSTSIPIPTRAGSSRSCTRLRRRRFSGL